MTRAELWKVFTDKNPKLKGDGNATITLRLRGLKKMFDAAWDEGGNHACDDLERDACASNDMPQFMKDFFGK